MAKHGLLPSKLIDVPSPMCASCVYGKATRRPWRTKGKSRQACASCVYGKATRRPWRTKGKSRQASRMVSVDQLESPTPGFIGQIKGILTTKRYTTATIFVDQKSRLGFVYLQQTSSAEETLTAKKAFEAYSRSHGVNVRHYHANNGRFAENLWLSHVEASTRRKKSVALARRGVQPDANLMRRGGAFPEWCDRETHSGPPGKRQDDDVESKRRQMAGGTVNSTVAVRPATCQ
jgi:hypothetical protein